MFYKSEIGVYIHTHQQKKEKQSRACLLWAGRALSDGAEPTGRAVTPPLTLSLRELAGELTMS